MVMSVIRMNMVSPQASPADNAERYAALLDMAAYADEHGVFAMQLEEHHSTAVGWSPTPVLNAGMILARTTRLSVTISALLLPLHDPIRVAEQLAVADLASGGRLVTIFGLGYRPIEYAQAGVDWSTRGARFDSCLETLLTAWTGEPFEHHGETVQVTPRPLTQPHPMIMIGGSSRPAARRAARFGLPLFPAANLPELEAYYNERCTEYGTSGFCIMPSAKQTLNFLSEDPDRTWAELGHHFLAEAQLYQSWQTGDIKSAVKSSASTVDELRAEGIYRVLEPSAMVAQLQRDPTVLLHPLCGGMPVESGWSCLRLFCEQVLPAMAN